MKRKNQVFMIVTNDKFEFPVSVGKSLKELCFNTGFSYRTVSCAFEECRTLYNRYRVINVDITEELIEEKLMNYYSTHEPLPRDRYFNSLFNFKNYTRFCKINKLKAGTTKALDMFKQKCLQTYCINNNIYDREEIGNV